MLKMVAGWEKPDQGEIRIGKTVKLGYFSQENEAMDESLKVIDYIRNVAEVVQARDGSITASQMLERFLFPGSMQHTLVGKLSGGEKRRLYLLRILMDAPNVLLLDEPTNDLDIQTLTVLEDYLDSFPGIVVAVSHDRYFLDRVARRIFAFEGAGAVVQYEGGFTDYQAACARKSREGALAGGGGSHGGATPGQKKPEGGQGGDLTGKQSPRGGRSHQKKLKFSYKEQKEWESIEDDIAALEKRLEGLEREIGASATIYGKLNLLMEEKEEAEKLLEEKMERWVYLNELAELIGEEANSIS